MSDELDFLLNRIFTEFFNMEKGKGHLYSLPLSVNINPTKTLFVPFTKLRSPQRTGKFMDLARETPKVTHKPQKMMETAAGDKCQLNEAKFCAIAKG